MRERERERLSLRPQNWTIRWWLSGEKKNTKNKNKWVYRQENVIFEHCITSIINKSTSYYCCCCSYCCCCCMPLIQLHFEKNYFFCFILYFYLPPPAPFCIDCCRVFFCSFLSAVINQFHSGLTQASFPDNSQSFWKFIELTRGQRELECRLCFNRGLPHMWFALK